MAGRRRGRRYLCQSRWLEPAGRVRAGAHRRQRRFRFPRGGHSMSPSRDLLDRSRKVLPGGVNSPVRAFRAVNSEPIIAREAHGAILTDVDDRKYIDYLMSWGA